MSSAPEQQKGPISDVAFYALVTLAVLLAACVLGGILVIAFRPSFLYGLVAEATPTLYLLPTAEAPSATPGAGTPVPSATTMRGTTSPTSTVTATATATPTPEGCTDAAVLVGDVTIPDNTVIAPGAPFTKTWQLRNTGTCTWTTAYSIVSVDENVLDGPSTQPLPGSVFPGDEVTISVAMTAPTAEGTYRSDWLLQNADGLLFGVGRDGVSPFWAQIIVRRPATSTMTLTATPIRTTTITTTTTTTPTVATTTTWRGEYFSNINLSGSPIFTRDDSEVNFDWGNGAPDSRLPGDNFSVRWTRTFNFDPGQYRFTLSGDDGVRLWADGQMIIDDWRDGVYRDLSATINLTRGAHTIRVEYYEHAGGAHVRLRWEKLGDSGYPDWRGEYWPTQNLSGTSFMVRNDRNIDFNWGQGAPATGMPTDNFSVKWTRTVDFAAALYRFHAQVDDGVRIWVNDHLVLDSWRDGALREVTADYMINHGSYRVRVEYYDRSGDARIRVWWEAIAAPTLRPLSADLTLDKQVDDNSPNYGDTVMFTITVRNNGPDTATNVAVTDADLTGGSYTNVTVTSTSQGSYAAGVWTVGNIASGGSATIRIEADIAATGSLNNRAEVTASDQRDPDSTPRDGTGDDYDTTPLTVAAAADLRLEQTVSNATPAYGDVVTFTLRVYNDGPNAATNVGLTHLDLITGNPNYTGITVLASGDGSYDTATGIWTIGGIANGGYAEIQIQAQVNATGTLDNRAEITASGQYDPDSTPGNGVAAEDDYNSDPLTVPSPPPSP